MNVSIKSCIRSSIRIGSFGSISDIFRHLCPLSLQWWQMSPGRFLNRHFDLKALITRGFSLLKSLLPLSIDSILFDLCFGLDYSNLRGSLNQLGAFHIVDSLY